MSVEQNKALVKKVVEEVYNKKNTAAIKEFYASNYVHHDLSLSPTTKQGVADFKQALEKFQSAFPDLQVKIEDLVGEGDKVVERWSCIGTFKGSLQGLDANGQQVSFAGTHILRIENGKIVEGWAVFAGVE